MLIFDQVESNDICTLCLITFNAYRSIHTPDPPSSFLALTSLPLPCATALFVMHNDNSNPAPPSVTDGVLVSVTDVHQVWHTLRIAPSIPLGRLEWMWTGVGSSSLRDSSTSARAIFHPVSAPGHVLPHTNPNDWYRNPYVYVYVTTIPSLEKMHDNPAWPAVRAFLDFCHQSSLEYIVILAATDEDVVRHKKLLDRLRADVNVANSNREHVVIVPPAAIKEEELRPITHLHHSPAHRDLLLRLRECVREAVNTRVKAYDDHVSRSILNRSSDGWTFGSFFVLKESMAFVFQQLGRRDLSVKFYEELHSLFSKLPQTSFSVFTDLPPADSARGLSDPSARDYRARLLNASITELDTHTYLFSRQMALLLLDHKYTEVAEKGLKLITTVASRAAELVLSPDHPGITSVFRDTWVFVSARAIADALTPSVPLAKDVQTTGSAQLATSRERHAVRLVAGFHVHALRAFSGLAHVVLPGCLGPIESGDPAKRLSLAAEAVETSHEELRDALSSQRKAEMFHSEIANSAASLYEMGGRARGAAALDGDSGVAHLRNESYRDAEALLSAQCLRFANDHGWDELHRHQRRELAKAEREMDRIQEYLVSCLTMLYMGRTSRSLHAPFPLSEEEKKSQVEECEYWIKEAVNAASRLPRIMRYKADRLFHVSILPNDTMWEEGNVGKVTARLKSDILAPLEVDLLSVELRLSDTSGPPKSVLRTKDEDSIPTSPGVESKSNEPSSPTASPLPSNDPFDVVLLKSAKGVVVKPGANDIEAQVNEVPVAGRYRVNLISLYLGNLKIVQQPSKSPLNLIVSTKGSGKVGLAPNSSSGITEIGACEAQFPFFFAAGRKPSASVEIEGKSPLYLAPQSRQHVTVLVHALGRGIASGAAISCALVGSSDDARSLLSGSFVRFSNEGNGTDDNKPDMGDDYEVNVRRVQRTVESDWDAFDLGQATIERDVSNGDIVKVKLALDVLPIDSLSSNSHMDLEADSRRCTLRVDLSWHELDGNTRREQSSSTESLLTFVSPLEITAHMELNSEWGAESVSRGVALDGTPLGDGGTLVCAVTSRVSHSEGITIRKMILQTPKWLELRPDEEPGHMSLVPCRLCLGGVFCGAFDVFVREGGGVEGYKGPGDRREVFGDNVAKRRMSRRATVDSNGDMMDIVEEVNKTRRGRRVEEDYGASGLSPEQEDEFEDARSSFLKEEEDGAGVDRDEGEVLDLLSSNSEAPGRNLNEGRNGNGKEKEVESAATLQLEVEIGGVAGYTTIERRVSMESIRVGDKRYAIERRMKSVGESGKIIELEFFVREISSRGGHYDSSDEAGVLQYEVDADPAIWVLVGKRRGKIAVGRNAGQGAGRAELVAISCGRHGVPCVRLYEHDGRAMAWSRYENVDEYMQVVVMPCRTIMSGCRVANADEKSEGDGKKDGVKVKTGIGGAMPVVIASDLFFGS